MDKVLLYEEYRLVERTENEINGAWKGAHLLLFFLAFVFGSFCTFCFHMLMYMFDEKCVLFPKLLALTSLRHSIIFEFIPTDKEKPDLLPVDFLNTQWTEKSVCYLPTYVPLVSGIFGLVWTTIFLMCSTGSQMTGLHRPWRILTPVLVFSLVMCTLCVYSSAVTHCGLEELCAKLSEFTGSTSCTYTVNVATLAYERRIRGVYQAIQLTILSAWLHTACWLLSAGLALARVMLVVDFQLVHITAELRGNLDRMLEHHEKQIRTVSPDLWIKDETERGTSTKSTRIHFKNKAYDTLSDIDSFDEEIDINKYKKNNDDTLYLSEQLQQTSELALVPEEMIKFTKRVSYVTHSERFISQVLKDLIDALPIKNEAQDITGGAGSSSSEMHESDTTETEDNMLPETTKGKFKKTNLKTTAIQTECTECKKNKEMIARKVKISESVASSTTDDQTQSSRTKNKTEKETQTEKEKLD